GLSALAITVGVAAVVLLASIGEGTRRYIMGQMTQFGTTLVAVYPGKLETRGMPGLMGAGTRKLTMDDARLLARIPGVVGAVPTAYGSSLVRWGARGRRVMVYGATSDVPTVWSMHVANGRFIPKMEFDRASPVVVLGPKLKRELFGDANALGEIVRIAETRFRVIGVMEQKGQFLGFDLDDTAFIPVASALQLFNKLEADEVDLLSASNDAIDSVGARATALLKERHQGVVDFTIYTQKESQGMVDRILGVIAGVVTGIAAISLLVGAIGIMTIMWIVVQERVGEIGLAKAIGATRGQILVWYLFESAVTAAGGGIAGLLIGLAGGWTLSHSVPGLSPATSP
ncbi:MAG: ABC transporter permease, partial [Candidatus Eisenbacteria bacterium]|nr:ABC transporter permease [Candidatus Eisenbacteria bacterium]